MDTNEKSLLRKSIESIGAETFGSAMTIYLDPEAEKLYTFDGSGVPCDAYHGIDVSVVSVRTGAIASSVEAYLLSIEGGLESLLEEYQGSEWNGSSHVGSWSEQSEGLRECMYQGSGLEIAYYWDAGDWFGPIAAELKSAWESGKTAEEIIDEQGCGDSVDGMCDRSDAIEWLTQQIGEWATESADEDN